MSLDTQATMYTDFGHLAELRGKARKESGQALGEVARQFEALFLQMMLKSMRDASLGDGLFDSSQTRMYQEMFDKQVATSMSEKGGLGIAEMLVKQLGRNADVSSSGRSTQEAEKAKELGDYARSLHPAMVNRAVEGGDPGAAVQSTHQAGRSGFDSPTDFVKAIWKHAREAAGKLGIAPEGLVAQAALETGWGQHLMRGDDNRITHNLFGIKADSRWHGERVSAETIEFRDGVLQREQAQFRAYGSFGESFADYVDFLRSSARYRPALDAASDTGSFFERLHQAGYATDPEYPRKIKSILRGETLNQAMSALNF